MKKKKAVLAAVLAAAGILAAGCGQKTAAGGWEANINSIYVTDSLEVESALVYTSDKTNELYTQEGMESFARDAVAAFNKEQGAEEASANAEGGAKLPVALKSSSLEGQTGTLVFEYGAPGYFASFAQASGDNTNTVTSLEVTRVSDAAGTLGDVTFTRPDGKAAQLSEVERKADSILVMLEGSATVYTQGKVAYISEGVTMQSEYAVVTPEAKSYIIFK